MSIESCRIIKLPKIADPRGSLTFVESGNHIPFEIRRVYYLYDVPENGYRGGHAHKELEQLMIAVSGSFDVALNDGTQERTFSLNRPDEGLIVTSMNWRELKNFSRNSVCMVLASQLYDENDYFRDYQQFLAAVRNSGTS